MQTVPSFYIYIQPTLCVHTNVCMYQAQKEVGGVPVDERAESNALKCMLKFHTHTHTHTHTQYLLAGVLEDEVVAADDDF